MNALYGLYPDAEGAQRAVDALRAASSELKLKAQQIVIVSGEPHEGYDFTDSQATSTPYRWAVLGAILTTLVVLLIGAGLPNFKAVMTDPEVGKGKILVGVVDPPESSQPELERRLRLAGASQVKPSAWTL